MDGNYERPETPEISLHILLVVAVMVASLCYAVRARLGPLKTHDEGTQTDAVQAAPIREYIDRLPARIYVSEHGDKYHGKRGCQGLNMALKKNEKELCKTCKTSFAFTGPPTHPDEMTTQS